MPPGAAASGEKCASAASTFADGKVVRMRTIGLSDHAARTAGREDTLLLGQNAAGPRGAAIAFPGVREQDVRAPIVLT